MSQILTYRSIGASLVLGLTAVSGIALRQSREHRAAALSALAIVHRDHLVPIRAAPPESRDPRVPLSPDATRWVDSVLQSLSPRARAAQLIHVWLLGDYESNSDSAFAVTSRWVRNDGIGGILMSVGSPIEVAVKLNALQAMSRVPLLVGCDVEPSIGRLEGGLFIPSMLKGGGATILPTNMAIGATADTALAYRAGMVTGSEARALGIHLAYAPVADVNNNSANPVINVRSFGEDPSAVAALVAAFTRGVQDGGALATVKHFPGHGDTETDSHNALPVVHLTHAHLDSVELRPFRAAINVGAAAVMSAHISNPTWLSDDLPATLQRRVLTDELRDSLHFRGLTITDALTMQGVARMFSQEEIAIRSVEAGAEVLLKPADVAPVLNALTARMMSDAAFAARIDAAARHNLEMKARVGLHHGAQMSLDSVRTVVGIASHRAVATEIATRAVTVLRNSRDALPLRDERRIQLVVYTPETEFGGGNAFVDEFQKHASATVTRIGPQTPIAALKVVAKRAAKGRLVVVTVVRRVEGRGRVAIAEPFAAWIRKVNKKLHPIVIAAGNPYVIGQFPAIDSYMATFSVGEAPERAAARALFAGVYSGTSPVSLPGVFARGDGVIGRAGR
jgi:beta-N-acetylhexosaminidase